MREPLSKPGDKHGRLTIKSVDGRNVTCRCECGKKVVCRGNDLRAGKTVSCGCQFNEGQRARSMSIGDEDARRLRAQRAIAIRWANARAAAGEAGREDE